MSDPITDTLLEPPSSVEISQNAKQEFSFSVKIYTKDSAYITESISIEEAQKKAVGMSKKCIQDIKNVLRPAL
ncbi:MAG TPA: hypothetical protein ENI23_06800 [bacterium]|nr:hypothetical protein [bacterium]